MDNDTDGETARILRQSSERGLSGHELVVDEHHLAGSRKFMIIRDNEWPRGYDRVRASEPIM